MFDRFEYKEVGEMKTFVSKGGFITQNQASSQNLSSLGGQKPSKRAIFWFFEVPHFRWPVWTLIGGCDGIFFLWVLIRSQINRKTQI